jgi:hypothetical protein
MIQKKYSALICLTGLLSISGCYYDPEAGGNDTIEGYVPVYGSAANTEIVLMQSRTVENPGKIYVYGKFLLVNEQKQGIHVFDNTNPSAPVSLGFIQLLGNTDMAIKDDILYADHLGNLVSLTIQDFTRIEETGRLPLRNWNLGIPPPAGFHFECVDPEKGIVVSWKKSSLQNPQCYAIQ